MVYVVAKCDPDYGDIRSFTVYNDIDEAMALVVGKTFSDLPVKIRILVSTAPLGDQLDLADAVRSANDRAHYHLYYCADGPEPVRITNSEELQRHLSDEGEALTRELDHLTS